MSPAPVTTSTRAPASAANASIASPSPTAVSASTQLRTSGRSMRTMRIAPWLSTVTFGFICASFGPSWDHGREEIHGEEHQVDDALEHRRAARAERHRGDEEGEQQERRGFPVQAQLEGPAREE